MTISLFTLFHYCIITSIVFYVQYLYKLHDYITVLYLYDKCLAYLC